MTCDEARARLGPYHDGEQAGTEHRRIKEHLRECRECAAHLEVLEDLSSRLRSAPDPALPASLWGRIESTISSRRPARMLRLWLIRLGAACAGALLVVAAWLVLGSSPRTRHSAGTFPWRETVPYLIGQESFARDPLMERPDARLVDHVLSSRR